MTIRQLSLTDFRNLKSTTLDFHPSLNFITGSNASGKTSLLEAIQVVSQGKSFRSNNLDLCVNHKKNSFLLFSLFDSFKVGVSRSSKSTSIRVDNETIKQISSLALKTPLKIINNSCFDLLLGSPSVKRLYLDWCLFHVEHDYYDLWVKHKHALKQRNALLKQKKNIQQLDYWDKHLSSLNSKIYKRRLSVFQSITAIFKQNFNSIIDQYGLDFFYNPGWDPDKDLTGIYLDQRHKDLRIGYTRFGIHRDDINIITSEGPAENILSRGQIKKISILMIMTQILFIKQETNKKIILLVDDIDAELDCQTVNILIKSLNKLKVQLFITSIDSTKHDSQAPQEYKMFHVEHGMIKTVKQS